MPTIVEIDDIAAAGVVRDEPAYMLPPETWSTALNMRSRDNGMVRMEGWTQIFGTPPVAPHFAMPVISPSTAFWLYTSLAKGYVYDGASHTDLTRAVGGDYTAANTRDWNGTIFGGIPILNNGADVPQYWAALSTGTKLAALPNWPGTLRAKVVRSLGAYMFGFNCTKGATVFPHMVKWSAEALQPGSPPPSWDETDVTLDAGEYDLYDVNSGVIKEAITYSSQIYVYKEQSTWTIRFVGGRAVFSILPLYETTGILAPRCAVVTGDGKNQVVVTQDDFIIHNGGQPASILEKKLRREIFGKIDTANYENCFLYVDPASNEVVWAYPESGMTQPNKGVVFNYKSGAVTEIDGITYRNAATGRIEAISEELWSDGTDTWDDDTGSWNTQERRRTVLISPANTKFYKLNDGLLRDGSTFLGTLQRTGLSILGRKRTGRWIVDHQIRKMVDRIWPKIKNGSAQLRFGFQQLVDGPVTWSAPVSFDPTTQVFCDPDPPLEGRAVAIEFVCAGDFRLDGYKLNVTPLAEF